MKNKADHDLQKNTLTKITVQDDEDKKKNYESLSGELHEETFQVELSTGPNTSKNYNNHESLAGEISISASHPPENSSLVDSSKGRGSPSVNGNYRRQDSTVIMSKASCCTKLSKFVFDIQGNVYYKNIDLIVTALISVFDHYSDAIVIFLVYGRELGYNKGMMCLSILAILSTTIGPLFIVKELFLKFSMVMGFGMLALIYMNIGDDQQQKIEVARWMLNELMLLNEIFKDLIENANTKDHISNFEEMKREIKKLKERYFAKFKKLIDGYPWTEEDKTAILTKCDSFKDSETKTIDFIYEPPQYDVLSEKDLESQAAPGESYYIATSEDLKDERIIFKTKTIMNNEEFVLKNIIQMISIADKTRMKMDSRLFKPQIEIIKKTEEKNEKLKNEYMTEGEKEKKRRMITKIEYRELENPEYETEDANDYELDDEIK